MDAVERFRSHLRAVQGRSAATTRNYGADTRRFLCWLQEVNPAGALRAVTAHDVRAYLIFLEDAGKATSTRRGATYALRAFFDFLIVEGLASHNPARQVPPVRADRPDIKPYNAAVIAQILGSLRKDRSQRGRLIEAMIYTLRYTGIRNGELAGIRLEWLDLDARRLRVLGKGNKPRTLPVPDRLAVALAEYLAEVRPGLPESPWLFPNPDPRCRSTTRQFTAPCIGRITERAAGAAGVTTEKNNPHLWRHSYATDLLRRGVDIHKVQRLLGHSSINTTTIYLHLIDDDLEAAVDDAFRRDDR